MPHTITIPDELWDAAGGSPMELRNQLYVTFMKHELRAAEAAGKARQEGKPVETAPASNGGAARGRAWGTLFIARKETICPFCETPVYPWDFATMTDAAGGKAIHARCAEGRGITLRWSARKLNECFRWLSGRPGVERVS